MDKNIKENKGELPEIRGNTYIKRILSVYIDLFRDKYGFVPTLPIGRFGKSLKTLMNTHTEMQIVALLIVFFNWQGMDDRDDFERNRLEKVTHSMGWFFSGINKYQSYLINVYGLDFEDSKAVEHFVRKNFNNL